MLKPMKNSDLHNNRRSANLRETNKDEKSFAGEFAGFHQNLPEPTSDYNFAKLVRKKMRASN